MIKYINNANPNAVMGIIKTKDVKKVNLEEEIVKMVKKLSDEAKNYVSDSHQYRNVNASVRNTFDNICGKAFGLTVEQTPDKFNRHFLTMNLLHPTMELQSTRTLAAGNKAEILEKINDKDFVKLFKNNLEQMSEKMQER